MLKKLALLLIFIMPSVSYADDSEWSLENTATLCVVLDWLQTRDIATNDRFYETNKYLGRYPDLGEVNRYFMTIGTLYYLLNKTPIKKGVNWWIVIEHGSAVMHNFHVGVRLKF